MGILGDFDYFRHFDCGMLGAFGKGDGFRADPDAETNEKEKEKRLMPILQYKCKLCGKKFEELVKSHTEKVVCPGCGGDTEREYAGTMYSTTGKKSSSCTGHCATCSGCR